MMCTTRQWLGIFVLVLFSFSACDSTDLQREFVNEAGAAPDGITRTDAGGSLILQDGAPVEVDSTDWRTSPAYAGAVRFDPAYPNPSRGEAMTIPFVVPFSGGPTGGLRLRGYDNTGRFVVLADVPEAAQAGSWVFVFSPADLSAAGDIESITGQHRLFVFDDRSVLVSYGDILIE